MAVRREDIENELRLKIANDAEVHRDAELFALGVRDRWVEIWEAMGPHPYETGNYVDSIEVRRGGKGRLRNALGRFIAGGVVWEYWVGTDSLVAAFLEYGTGPDVNGVGSWQDLNGNWHKSPNTPTPEFAPAAKTAAFYHGTTD